MEVKRTYNRGSVIAQKFEVVRLLGEGSLGDDVYQGKQLDLERDVIIRVLPQSVSEDPEMVKRFIQETKLNASLQHPSILAAYEAGEFFGRYFLVTAYEPGSHLDDYLQKRGQLEEKESINLLVPLAEALDYAWDTKQVLHRNIRPESILVTKGDQAMLEDFGMAKCLSEESQDLTMAGFTIGNPEYMSPEQTRGEQNLDCRSDIYCLGLLFYEMLAGKPPFQSKSPVALMEMHLREAHQPIRESSPRTKEGTAEVLDKMLAKEREERYQNYKDLLKDLKAIQNDLKPPSIYGDESTSGKKEKPKKKAQKNPQVVDYPEDDDSGKSKNAIIIAAIVVIAVIIIAALFFLSGSGPKADKAGQKEMWDYAVENMTQNPNDFEQAISFFEKIKTSCSGTKYELMAEKKIKELKEAQASSQVE